jgi:RNA 3'-terminal phosphate cyclase
LPLRVFARSREIADPLIIDGAHGEGGGQILRTALSLSTITSRAFRLVNIRAKRRNPGLQPQHLSATRAAAAISDAELTGDVLRSSELVFAPTHPPQGGSYRFDVAEIAGHGSAGSAILILQTVLWLSRKETRRSWCWVAPIRIGRRRTTILLMLTCLPCAGWD